MGSECVAADGVAARGGGGNEQPQPDETMHHQPVEMCVAPSEPEPGGARSSLSLRVARWSDPDGPLWRWRPRSSDLKAIRHHARGDPPTMGCFASLAVLLTVTSCANGFVPRPQLSRITSLVGPNHGRPTATLRRAEPDGGSAVDPNEVDMEALKAQRKEKVNKGYQQKSWPMYACSLPT